MRYYISALVLLGTAVLTGCSDSDTEPTPATPSTSTAPEADVVDEPAQPPAEDDEVAELRASVQAYSDAFLAGDGARAYAALSSRCRDRFTEAEFGAIVAQAGDLYGSELEFTSYDADVEGSLARVTYSYEISGIDQDREPWSLEDGSWRNDDC